MRDDVDAQHGIAVIAPDRLDQPVEPARRLDVVLAPVVGVDVIAALAGLRGGSDRPAYIAAEVAQGLDELTIEILAECRVRDVERFQVVGTYSQRLRVEIERETAVVVEQDHPRRARPRLRAGGAIAQLRTEHTGDDDDRGRVGELRADAIEPAEVRVCRRRDATGERQRGEHHATCHA